MAGRSFKVNMAADGGVAGISTRSMSDNCCSFNNAACPPVMADPVVAQQAAPGLDAGFNA